MSGIKLSRMQNETLDVIRSYGEAGANIDDLMTTMQLSRASIYKHTERLIDVNLIKKTYKRGDKRLYLVAGQASGMHMLPGMGDKIPAMPVSTFLSQWQFAENLYDWSFLKTVAKFPYLVGKVAEFAHRMASDDMNTRPSRAEKDEVRLALTQISQRCQHMSQMCQSLLTNDSLWDRHKAHKVWFQDEAIPFDVATAKAALKQIEILLTPQSAPPVAKEED